MVAKAQPKVRPIQVDAGPIDVGAALARLTPAQATIWEALRGQTPLWLSVSQIADAAGVSRQAVSRHLRALCESGFAKVQSWNKKASLYRATLPLGPASPSGADQQFLRRIQERMRRHVAPHYASSWQTSMQAALKAGRRPDFLFDVNSIMHPAFCADGDLRITGWSKAFETLFGVPNGLDIFTFFRLFNMHVYDPRTGKVDQNRHAVDAIRESLANEGRVNQLPVFLKLKKSYEFLEVSCVIQLPYQGVQSIMPISKDLRVMRELRDQEQQFAASLYHDFNTPLWGLALQLSLLTGGGGARLPEGLEKELREMLETVTSLQQSLGLYRSYPGDEASTAFDPIAVLNRLLPVARVMHPDIRFDEAAHTLRPELYLAPGTAYWFQQAVRNVIRNAVEAISEGRKTKEGQGVIEIRSVEKGEGEIEIAISDNGCGMSADVLRELNGSAQLTTKTAGDHRGVGVTILRKVTEMAGGFQPSFESTLGVGTTVHIPLMVDKRRVHE